jgi:hypothetical protein
MVQLIMAAFIFSGCNFFPSIMPDFWVVLYFPLTIRESRWLLILARHSLDVQILIFVVFFDFEVKLSTLSICIGLSISIFSYCNCGFNDTN